MKYKYKSILFVAFGLFSLTALAQKDSTITRQVLLEREYTPTMQDASRINTTPAIYEHSVKRSEVSFAKQAPVLGFPHNKLGRVSAGDIGSKIPYNTKRGYFEVAAGTKANIEGAAGYRLLDTKTDRLDVFANYYSMNGDVDYANKGYLSDKMKAKYSDIKAKIKYQHTFEPSVLTFFAGYGNMGFNYYGNSFIPSLAGDEYSYDFNTKQSVDVISVGAGLKSSDENRGDLKYDGNIAYDYFKNKHGLIPADEGMKGGIISADVDFYAEMQNENFVGIRGSILNQSYSNSEQKLKDVLHSYTNVTANPYYRMEGGTWSAELGLSASGLFDEKTKVFVNPNIKANVNFSEVSTLYGAITGGVNNNTFLDILQENRYIIPLGRVNYSKTQYDLQVGFKSGALAGFEFDIFGGYKSTKDDHLYMASPMVTLAESQWGNVSIPAYAKIGTGHAGAMVKTYLIPYTVLSAKATGYFYSVKDLSFPDMDSYEISDKKAWGRPSFTAELNLDIKPTDELTISGNYLLSAGRKAFARGTTVNMKNINEVNARAAYRVTDWFTIDAKANNLLNQKYDLVYGYTLQGFNVMGGFNFTF